MSDPVLTVALLRTTLVSVDPANVLTKALS